MLACWLSLWGGGWGERFCAGVLLEVLGLGLVSWLLVEFLGLSLEGFGLRACLGGNFSGHGRLQAPSPPQKSKKIAKP